jgi:hypothetical protein
MWYAAVPGTSLHWHVLSGTIISHQEIQRVENGRAQAPRFFNTVFFHIFSIFL